MFLGLSVLQLVLGGLAIASVGSGLWATANHFENVGERNIEEKYAPMVAQCRDVPGFFGGEKKISPPDCAKEMKLGVEALAKNVELQQSLKDLTQERQACSDAVKRIQKQGQRTVDLIAARKPADDKVIAQVELEKEVLIEALPAIEALNIAGKLTCEQRLARRDAMWARVAKEQMRDFPPTSAPKPSSDAVIIKGVKP